MKLIIRLIFGYDDDDKKTSTEIFMQSIKTPILLNTNSSVSVDDFIKSIENMYEDIGKQMDRSVFSFKYVGSLSIRLDKVSEEKESSYLKAPNWLRYKNSTIKPNKFNDRCKQ